MIFRGTGAGQHYFVAFLSLLSPQARGASVMSLLFQPVLKGICDEFMAIWELRLRSCQAIFTGQGHINKIIPLSECLWNFFFRTYSDFRKFYDFRKFSDLRKIFRFLENFQIFGKFLDFRKFFRFSENFLICPGNFQCQGKFSDLSGEVFRFVRGNFQICPGKFSDLSGKIFRFVWKNFQICLGNFFRYVRGNPTPRNALSVRSSVRPEICRI